MNNLADPTFKPSRYTDFANVPQYEITQTLQEMFDQVVTHLANQKRRAMIAISNDDCDGTVCAYYLPTGERCAVGGVLPVEVAKQLGFSETVGTLFRSAVLNSTTDHMRDMLGDLQVAHDLANTLEDLRNRLLETSQYFVLNPAIIDLITEWDGSYVYTPEYLTNENSEELTEDADPDSL